MDLQLLGRTEVLNKLPAFISDGTQRGLCSWLRAIVHAKAVDLLRYESRRPTKRLYSDVEASLLSRDTDPAAEYEARRRQEAVRWVLAALRERVSELTYCAFYKHWVEGHTVKQIAAELNVAEHKLSCRIYKANRKFRLLSDQLVQKDLLTDG